MKFTIAGRVQGVGFRAFVVTLARSLDVKGEVWNDRSGEVVCVAVADDETLKRFEQELWHGPGRVDRVTKEPSTYSSYQEFDVGSSR